MEVNLYILDFGPWKWSALNMSYMDKRPSRMQGLNQVGGVRPRSGFFGVAPAYRPTSAMLVGGI